MRPINKGSVLLFFLLFAFWVMLIPDIGWIESLIGLLAVLLVMVYGRDMIFTKDEIPHLRISLFWRIPFVLFTLLTAMVKANIQVAKIVLSREMPLSPEFRKVNQPVKKDVTRAFYGNAITLTPGTLSVDVKADHLLVHCLTKEAAEGIEGSALEKAFKALEVDHHD
ncbi:MAG: Na+/H+ antiporter subunit E [Bacillota bacterium]